MAILDANHVTLLDLMQRTDKNDNILPIVEILNTAGGALADMPFVEANDGQAHITSMRTGIPAGTFRQLYMAVQPEKSIVTQIKDTAGHLETLSEIDYQLARMNGMKADFMLSEQIPFIEGLNQTMRRQLWYGDEKVNIAGFTGLHVRYITKTAANAANAVNVIDAGGSADAAPNMQSAWLLTLGQNTLHGIYPKGSQGGLVVIPSDGEPETSETFLDPAGNAGKMRVLRSWYEWDMGLCLRDWRYQARVCNISVKVGGSNTASVYDRTGGGTNYLTNLNNLLNSMISAAERLPTIGVSGRTGWYVSRQVRESLRFAIL